MSHSALFTTAVLLMMMLSAAAVGATNTTGELFYVDASGSTILAPLIEKVIQKKIWIIVTIQIDLPAMIWSSCNFPCA